MKARLILWLVFSSFFGFGTNALAGDSTCYGYKSEIAAYFSCGEHGNCVWWAAYKRPDLAAQRTGTGWNAVQWYDKFKALGFPVGSKPKAGAVAVFDATDKNSAGHVAYVENVNDNGSFDVSEMDYFGTFGDGLQYGTYHPDGNGKYHRNNGKSGTWTLKGFIYHKETCDPSKERCGIKTNGPIGWYPPVEHCEQASQWFRLVRDTANQVSRVESATKSACPLACYAN